jgi:hypothetical protein
MSLPSPYANIILSQGKAFVNTITRIFQQLLKEIEKICFTDFLFRTK